MFSNASPGMDALASNALDLFPATTTPQNAQLKLQKLLYATQPTYRGPTQIQSSLAASLYDDAVEYMNTLEMNRAASYTFGFKNSYGQNGTTVNDLGGGTRGESVADEMWELLLDLTLGRYARHSVLALTKTISLIQHILLHGSEACVTDGALLYRIETALEPLRNLNTALVEQRTVEHILNGDGRASGIDNDVVLTVGGISEQLAQFGTRATAAMVKMRGGSVDRGHPVRQAASKLSPIVSIPGNLKQIRMQQANQQGSLVPVGSTKQVGYITDEGRLRLLQEKMAAEEKVQKQKQWQEQQRRKQIKSNLAGRSATDSFGGGYTSSDGGGKIVVGAAHSLEDMIESARFELEQHKAKRRAKIDSMHTGFCDDPYARARQVAELETQNIESDPEFVRREKALKDALDYLEEMQKLEQEKAGDLLEGDLLGDAGGGAPSGGGMAAGGNDGGADLLGFDSSPAPAPATDVFGGAPAPSGTTNDFGGGGSTADLLGFDGFASPAAPANSTPNRNAVLPGYIGGGANSSGNNTDDAVGVGGGGLDLRPSLLTGVKGGNLANTNDKSTAAVGGPSLLDQPPPASSNFSNFDGDLSSMGAMGGVPGTGALGGARGTLQPESEEAQAESSRKMKMAAGLFAGVVPDNAKKANSQKKPIMAMGNDSSRLSALDDLIPMTGTPVAPAPTSNHSAFGANDLASAAPSSDPFGMGPMGGAIGNAAVPAAPSMAPPPPSSSDPFGMGPMGGTVGGADPFGMGPMGGSAAPPTAPPPPPMEPPPPAPSMAPPPPPSAMAPGMAAQTMAPGVTPNDPSNAMGGGNPSVEQMQEMIKQQQAQMAQMMQMMQHMQMQGGGANNGAGGGWP